MGVLSLYRADRLIQRLLTEENVKEKQSLTKQLPNVLDSGT